MSGIYQASNYCDDCCIAIAKDLLTNKYFPAHFNDADISNLRKWAGNVLAAGLYVDSDEWPIWGYPDTEPSDSPNHCANGELCANRLDLYEYGLSHEAELKGAETRYVGAIISGLSLDGQNFLKTLERPKTPYQVALHYLWSLHFSDYIR